MHLPRLRSARRLLRKLFPLMLLAGLNATAADSYLHIERNERNVFGNIVHTAGDNDNKVSEVIWLLPGIVMVTDESTGIRYRAHRPLTELIELEDERIAVVLTDVTREVWWHGRIEQYFASADYLKNLQAVLGQLQTRFPRARLSACGNGAQPLRALGFNEHPLCRALTARQP